ncbi:YqzE family protein [Desertibacillus haloalkaliphilus]|uniref:YqzE family protein n=1 Tax=Desertibacillus haloalkaliphilus TaxID=1328930 RepID=UPI001C2755B2|nr:YqzE family protein [Desertibacillus haloalkaliphilus]MBU8908985.1 YqzE family protein [Desertibacillus haloalkaliphilus]
MSLNDYVKFLTEQFVTYVDRPKEEQRAKKEELKAMKLPFHYHWFGLLPLSISIFIKKFKSSKKQRSKKTFL